jgi:hypothetical protein
MESVQIPEVGISQDILNDPMSSPSSSSNASGSSATGAK